MIQARQSGFGDVDRTDDPTKYVRRLDQTGALPLWRSIKQRMLEVLAVSPGDRILDVGCGTGDDTRALAELVGPSGRVVGIDFSQTMVAEARRRATGAGLPVDYGRVDAQALCFADDSFDGCRVERVLQHLDDPRRAVAEMVRVTRPGTRIVVAEPDYGSLAIQGGDPDVTRRIVACRCAHFRRGTIGRELPALFKGAGLRDLTVALITSEQRDLTLEHRSALSETFVAPAQAAGAIAPDEASRWLADVAAAGAAGHYRYVATIFLVGGRKS